jgi:hypothetical protein
MIMTSRFVSLDKKVGWLIHDCLLFFLSYVPTFFIVSTALTFALLWYLFLHLCGYFDAFVLLDMRRVTNPFVTTNFSLPSSFFFLLSQSSSRRFLPVSLFSRFVSLSYCGLCRSWVVLLVCIIFSLISQSCSCRFLLLNSLSGFVCFFLCSIVCFTYLGCSFLLDLGWPFLFASFCLGYNSFCSFLYSVMCFTEVHGFFFVFSFKDHLLKLRGNSSLKTFLGVFYFGFLSMSFFTPGSTGATRHKKYHRRRLIEPHDPYFYRRRKWIKKPIDH